MHWVLSVAASTVAGTALGLVTWLASGSPIPALAIGLAVGVTFDLAARRRSARAAQASRELTTGRGE